MYAAVAQLAVVQVGFLRSLSCELRYARHCLAFLLALLYLLLHHLSHVSVYVQVVVHFGFYEVAHILVDAHSASRLHCERAELYLGLAFKHRLLHVDGYRRHQTVAYVAVFIVLAEVFLYRPRYVFLESALVSAPLRGVLSVHEGVIFLSVLVRVCESYLDVLALHVYDRVEPVGCHCVVEQVLKSVPARYPVPVVHYDEPGVQVSIVAQHRLHIVVVERIVGKQRAVRLEEDVCSLLVAAVLGYVVNEVAPFEREPPHLSLPVGAHLEARAQRVHRLHSHAVQSDTFLERLRVVLSSRVEHAHRLHELSLRYTPSVVAHAHPEVVLDVHLDAFAGVHLELVNRVVYHFLEQDVYSVFRQRAVVQSADVHSRSGAHVLHVGEVPDVVVRIFYCLYYFVFVCIWHVYVLVVYNELSSSCGEILFT